MTQIFISYSRVDKKFTKELAELLGHAYDHVWYDTAKLVGGDKWWETILAQIKTCDHFIFLLSPESIASEFCQKELVEAIKLSKHIIPLRIRDRTNIPESLASLHSIDCFDEITVDALNKIYSATIRRNSNKENDSKNEVSIADIKTLAILWPYITGRKIGMFVREIEYESISQEIFNSLDEFKYLRSLPEYKFLNKQLEKSFSTFTSKLAKLLYITSLNVWFDRYTNSYVSARKSANNEGRKLEHETEVILRYENEVLNRATLLQQQHKKLVQIIKVTLPNFELEKA